MRTTNMIHTLALWRDLPHRDKTVKVPEGAAWSVPEENNPWKEHAPFTAAELTAFVKNGIATRKLHDFQPIGFSENLVPARPLHLSSVEKGTMGLYTRGPHTFFTWIEHAPADLHLQGKAGIVYTNIGPAKIDLYPIAEPEMKSVMHVELAPDKQDYEVTLHTAFTGLHRIEIADQTSGTALTWPDGMPSTVLCNSDKPAEFQGRWTLYFYVPKGTKIVGGFAQGQGELLNSSGKVVYTLPGKPGYFSVPVTDGEDGRLWKWQRVGGKISLLTVPPCLARDSQELLLPAEVVEKDSQR
jgi:hypothetical protein